MLVSACFSVSKSAQNLAFSLNNLTAGREFSKKLSCPLLPPCPPKQPASTQILGLHPKPRERAQANPPAQILAQRLSPIPPFFPNPRMPAVSCEVLAAVRWRVFAARLRQPCGGEGSEGRALAIPRASGAGWAGVWVARLLRRGNWLSNDNGGAQGSTNTRRNHRRRNRSPAWLLAPRSA